MQHKKLRDTFKEEQLVISISGLSKTYTLGFFRKKIHALHDVTFQIFKGEIFGLLGPNGAGKTTTLKILMGLVKRTNGHVELFQKPLGNPTVKSHIGYLPENPYYYDYLTGRELLIFMGELFGLSAREAKRRADELLFKVGLSKSATLPLRRYSKGMLQRVGLAQTLINSPELIILDEPMSGLDPIGRKDVRELILELKREKKTLLVSSHILSDMELLADRVAIVVQGKTMSTGPLHELLHARILQTDMVITGISKELLEYLKTQKIHYTHQGEALHLVLKEGEPVQPVIQHVLDLGSQIYMIQPRKEPLEDVVIQHVQGGAS